MIATIFSKPFDPAAPRPIELGHATRGDPLQDLVLPEAIGPRGRNGRPLGDAAGGAAAAGGAGGRGRGGRRRGRRRGGGRQATAAEASPPQRGAAGARRRQPGQRVGDHPVDVGVPRELLRRGRRLLGGGPQRAAVLTVGAAIEHSRERVAQPLVEVSRRPARARRGSGAGVARGRRRRRRRAAARAGRGASERRP